MQPDFPAEQALPTADALAPEQAGPGPAPKPQASLLRDTYDYIKREKLKDVADALPDDYAQFEAGMLSDPANVQALHALFKEQRWEGAELDDDKFADLLLGELKKKAPSAAGSTAAGLPASPGGAAEAAPALPTGDQEFAALSDQPGDVQPLAGGPAAVGVGDVPAEVPTLETAAPVDGPASSVQGQLYAPGDEFVEAGLPRPSGEELAAQEGERNQQRMAALAQLPGGARPQLLTDGGGSQLLRQYGALPALPDGEERVQVPADYAGELPTDVKFYRLPQSTDPGALYFNRPLSDEVAGEGKQSLPLAAGRNFNNLIADGFKGLATGADAASRLISNATGLSRGGGFGQLAEEIEGTKKPVAPLYQGSPDRSFLEHPNVKNLVMAGSDVAGMAVPLVAQALVPEGKAGTVLARVLNATSTGVGLSFEGQFFQGAHDRAVAAGMNPDQAALYTVLDGGLSAALFKGGGALLGRLEGKLAPEAVKSEIMREAYRILSQRGSQQLTRAEVQGVLAQASQAATPRLLRVLAEGGKMGALFGANEAKTLLTEAAARSTIGARFTPPTLLEALKKIGGASVEGALIGGATGAAMRRPSRTLPLGQTGQGRTLSAEVNEAGQVTGYVDGLGQPVDFGPEGPPPAVAEATAAAQAASPAPVAPEQLLSHQKVPVLNHRQAGQLFADFDQAGKPVKLYSEKGEPFALDDPAIQERVAAAWPDAPKGEASEKKPAASPAVVPQAPLAVEATVTPPAEPKRSEAIAPAPVYASVTGDGQVPTDRTSPTGMNRQTLVITPDPADPTKASFTLNPAVDQAWLVGADLSRNDAFFDRNATVNAPTAVLPEAAGRMELRDGAWHVTEKAKLKIEDGSNADTPADGTRPDAADLPSAIAAATDDGSAGVSNEQASAVQPATNGPAGASPVGPASSGPAETRPVVAPPYGTPEQNRAAGRFEKDGQTYERPAPLGEKLTRGKQATAEFSKDVQQPVQYAVVEATDLQPSHLGGTQNLRHFLPEAQPKNRAAAFDQASQKAISDIAAAPDLGRLGEAPNAYSGAPIVNQRGEVLQGNGRAAGIRQHYQQGGESYRADVVAAAERAGIPASRTTEFKEPVLVRVAEVSDQRARELGNYSAADTESGGQRRLDARQASGRLSEKGRADLGRLLTPVGDATLTETIRGNAAELLRLLRREGAVTDTQVQTMTKPDGSLRPEGVEDVAALYRQQLFADGDPNLPELFAELPAPAQGGLDRAVGSLVGLPEAASLVPEVQNAVGGVRELLASGADFNTWAGQADMFREGRSPRERYSPLELKLIELLATEKRPTYIARAFAEYAAAVKGEAASLFGATPPKSRAEAATQVFGVADERPAGNPRAEAAAPEPVAADGRPAPPAPSGAPGPAADARAGAQPAGPDSRPAPPGGRAATAEPAAEQRPAVARRGSAYVAPDGTEFTGKGAKARAGEHAFATGLVGQRVRAYDGSVDVVEAVKPKKGGGFTYTVRSEATGKARTHGTFIGPDQVLGPAEAGDVRASGPKFYADLAEAPPVMQQPGRIAPEPIRGERPKAKADILLDVRKGTGLSIFFTKRPGGRKFSRALGSYNPRNAAVAIKAEGDLDVTAHELGHALDDHYDLLPKASPAALTEIDPLARFGSQPPAGHPNPQNYRQGEALAEFVRAYLVNPDATQAAYPEFTRHYEATVPQRMRAAVDGFGRDIRVFAGATAHEQIMSNVRMKPAEPDSFWSRLRPDASGKNFYLTFGDRVQATMLNALQPFEKAMRYAAEVGGRGQLKPEENPTVLAHLFLGLNDKMDNLMRRGLVDSRNQRRVDQQTGQVKNLTWLLDPLDKTTEGTIGHEQELTVSALVARRTVELVERRVAEEIEEAHARGEYVRPVQLKRFATLNLKYGAENQKIIQASGARAKINWHQADVVSGVGGGVFTDLAVVRQRLADHEALAVSNPAQYARIEEAGRRYQSWADDNLRYLVERGRLSQEQYDAIKERNAQYVAMQRVLEAEPGAEIQVFARGGGSKNFTLTKEPIRAIKGSGRTIDNPYSGLLDATYQVTREGDRNAIMQAARELWQGSGRGMNDGDVEALGAVARPAQADDANVVTVYVDGKAEHWQLDADVFEAIQELGNLPLDGPLAKILQSPAQLLRWSVTHSPVFAVRNVIRDQRGRLIVSTNTPEAGLDVLFDKQKRTEAQDGLELSGGGQAGHYLRDPQAYYDTQKQEMRRLATDKRFILADPKRLASAAWEKYERLLGGSETIGRLQEYRAAFKKAKRQGMDDYNASLFAAYEARDLMDFAVAGTFLRQFNKYVPFSNAAVQGLRRAARSFKENPGGMTTRWLLYSVVPTVLVRALVHQLGRDDEYRELPAYQRDGFDNIPLPGNKWLVIPRPFELGTMAASADRFLSAHVFDNDPNAWAGYLQGEGNGNIMDNAITRTLDGSVAKSLVPVDESAVAGGLKPLVEVLTNHDFFKDKNIISPSEEKLDLSLRHTERGSRVGQWIGQAVGMDSRNVDHLISGAGSYYGNWLLKASNIGREDGGQTFGLADLGFIKEQPVTQARDVQWMQNQLDAAGLGQSRPARKLDELLAAYYAAKNPAERQRAGRLATELAAELRTLLDEKVLLQVGQVKKDVREAGKKR